MNLLRLPQVWILERYLWSTIQALILAIVVLVLALFVVRPLLTQRPQDSPQGLLPMSLEGPMSLDGPASKTGLPAPQNGNLLPEMIDANAPTDPVEMLKSLAAEQTGDAADLLASWLDQDTQAAG